MWAWMSTPPGITTIPRASMRRACARHVADDLAVLHADVAHLAGDAVGRVVHATAGDPQHQQRPPIAARTASTLGRSAASGARSGSGTPSIRWSVPGTSIPSAAVANADPGRARRRRRPGVDDDERQLAQAGQARERIGGHDERGVDVAALEELGGARALAREAAGEAHGPRIAGLPREHVLGARARCRAAQREA